METYELAVFIDIYGRVGLYEKFPNSEEYQGLNDLLDTLVDGDFYGDRYTNLPVGNYKAKFEITSVVRDIWCGVEDYMQIESIVP